MTDSIFNSLCKLGFINYDTPLFLLDGSLKVESTLYHYNDNIGFLKMA